MLDRTVALRGDKDRYRHGRFTL